MMIANPQGKRTSFVYDDVGRQVRQQSGNSGLTTQIFDVAGQMTGMIHATGVGTLHNRVTYAYDAAGNRTSAREMDGTRTTWTYDATSQLKREQRNGSQSLDVTHIYDPAGNRLVQLDNGSRTTFTFDGANQLLTERPTGSARTTYSYDNSGNRSRKTEFGGLTDYLWDEENRLTVVKPVGSPVTMTWNASDKRVGKQTSATTTRKFLYDFDRLLQEADGTDVTQKEFTSTLEQYGSMLSAFGSGSTQYFEADALGSTDALIDDSQSVTDRYKYRAFGLATHTQGSSANNHTWVGKQNYFQDNEVGLYLLDRRLYDPAVARFLSEDPEGFRAGDNNLYRYCANNPINAIDPSGRYLFGDSFEDLFEASKFLSIHNVRHNVCQVNDLWYLHIFEGQWKYLNMLAEQQKTNNPRDDIKYRILKNWDSSVGGEFQGTHTKLWKRDEGDSLLVEVFADSMATLVPGMKSNKHLKVYIDGRREQISADNLVAIRIKAEKLDSTYPRDLQKVLAQREATIPSDSPSIPSVDLRLRFLLQQAEEEKEKENRFSDAIHAVESNNLKYFVDHVYYNGSFVSRRDAFAAVQQNLLTTLKKYQNLHEEADRWLASPSRQMGLKIEYDKIIVISDHERVLLPSDRDVYETIFVEGVPPSGFPTIRGRVPLYSDGAHLIPSCYPRPPELNLFPRPKFVLKSFVRFSEAVAMLEDDLASLIALSSLLGSSDTSTLPLGLHIAIATRKDELGGINASIRDLKHLLSPNAKEKLEKWNDRMVAEHEWKEFRAFAGMVLLSLVPLGLAIRAGIGVGRALTIGTIGAGVSGSLNTVQQALEIDAGIRDNISLVELGYALAFGFGGTPAFAVAAKPIQIGVGLAATGYSATKATINFASGYDKLGAFDAAMSLLGGYQVRQLLRTPRIRPVAEPNSAAPEVMGPHLPSTPHHPALQSKPLPGSKYDDLMTMMSVSGRSQQRSPEIVMIGKGKEAKFIIPGHNDAHGKPIVYNLEEALKAVGFVAPASGTVPGVPATGNPSTVVIYRKMSAAEAAKTLDTKQLQPKVPGSNGKKYLSESLDKVKEFENKGVPKGTDEVIVEFTLDKAKYDALLADKVPQKLVGETPGGRGKIEYHYEGLPQDGPHINIGVPDNQLPGFNGAVIDVRILPPKK